MLTAKFSVILLLTASGCCLSVGPDEILGGTATGTGTGTGGGSSSGGMGSTTGGMAPDSGPCGETCMFQTAETVTCGNSVVEASTTLLGMPLDFWIKPLCKSSSSLSWSLSEGASLPPGLTFQVIGYPPVADISGIATSVPDPNPATLNLTVSDGDGDIGHVQVILTVNQ